MESKSDPAADAPHEAASPPPFDMDRLIAVFLDLSMARSKERVQEIVRHAARDITNADGAAFVLREGENCYYADEDAIEPLWKGLRFPMSACVSGWVMRHRQSVVIEDVYQDPRVPIGAYKPTFVKSLAMIPIRSQDPVGAIGVYWAIKRKISDTQLRLLQALADSTSIAIENVNLLAELRVAKDAAEEASRLKDEFLATISHELRTPLTPILSWAAVLAEADVESQERVEAAKAIQACAQQQLRQVEMLLNVSQILAGRFRLTRLTTGLDGAVRSALAEVADEIAAKSLDVQCCLDTAGLAILADPDRLQEIAWHLLANAIKFTPKGGRIRVVTKPAGSHLLLIVEDSGQGIPEHFVPHVFERFRQADGSMVRAANGLGIGLALVRQLVELHGGQVSVASPGSGQGATFTVSIPISGAA